MPQTAIVLQGGGALGAYEYGVLRRLFAQPTFRPNLISGLSIGAINAAVIVGGRGDPLAALGRLWDRFTTVTLPFAPDAVNQFAALFGNLSFYRVRHDFQNALRWTSFYDVEPLRRELLATIDFDKLNESPIRLLITATDIETGQPVVFDNHDPVHGPITVDHIIASGSLPPGFPVTTIDGRSYWDGGLFDNTPIAPVLERMREARKRRVVVVNVFPSSGRVPENMMDVLDRVFEIAFANRLRLDVRTMNRVNEFVTVMCELDQVLPKDSPIRDMPGFVRLKGYQAVEDIVVIENQRSELVFAPFDFSKSSIEARIQAGDADAAAKLAALQT